MSAARVSWELGVHRSTFYAWYRRYQGVGATGLVPPGRRPPGATGTGIPPRVRHRVVEAALADPAKSPRELAWQFTDQERHFLSESSVYRILKAEDLITRSASVVLSEAKTFAHPTHRPNELWQTDFTYLQVVGWGWYYLSRLKRRQGRLGDTWFLDEVFVAINDQRQYLWRAVDQDGDLIDLLVQPRRDGRAAWRFFRKLLKSQRQEPCRLVTDELGSYRVAHRDVMVRRTIVRDKSEVPR